MQLLIFGGSQVQGVGDLDGGWADLIKRWRHNQMFQKGGRYTGGTFNLGVAGDTAAQTLERMKHEIPERRWLDWPMTIIFAGGANSSRSRKPNGDHDTTPEDFAKSLRAVVELARQHKAQILFVGMTPLDDMRTRPTPAGFYFSNERLLLFDQIMTHVAHAEGVQKVELFAAMRAHGNWKDFLFDDGQHPNKAGHSWIFEQIKTQLVEMLVNER
jgi:lysophospholipase L1-like esterase